MIFTLIFACIGYVVLVSASYMWRHFYKSDTKSIRTMWHLLAGIAPIATAIGMSYIFLIVQAESVAQFNVGSPSRADAWSLWVDMGRIFIKLSFITFLATIFWTAICAVNKEHRHSIITAIYACLLSILAMLTIAVYAPTA